MSYFGGKGSSGVYQTLINQIPRHDAYISVFAGMDHVLQRIRPASRTVIIDVDPTPLNWWAQTRVDAEIYQCDGVNWLKHEFGLNRFRDAQDARSNDAGSGDRIRNRRTPAGRDSRYSDAGSDDAGSRDSVPAFVMIDPPYPSWTRTSSHRYAADADGLCHHRSIIAASQALASLEQPPAIMICSYPNAIYDAAFRDWRSQDYESTVRSGERRTERIWMNYPEPETLHDYSYWGADKREREKLRRRIRNTVADLRRRPPKERAAVLEYLAAEFGDATR